MPLYESSDIKKLKKLLKRCSKGNKNAQEHLYRIYYGYAMSIALRYSKSRIEAEEICNDAFFKWFTKKGQCSNVESFKPWFRRIIINTAIDSYRSKVNQNHLVLLEQIEVVDQAKFDFKAIEAEEIIALMQSLTPMYRMFFNLYVIEGFNHEEIAEKLNITASTSRSNLTRAKQKLRELINDYYYEQAR
ncbi:RNA polymerase sigma factor [Saccharicrinis sp. 156]|uniref:RNA polymerase sigma factor n=1 Tax=Saccharicrinis sp. 156 TaxID=3417574 RepID=UPI003D356038